jgi:hypothetical protein
MQQQYLGFIARSLYMFRALSAPIISITITVVELKLNHGDVTNRPILDNS